MAEGYHEHPETLTIGTLDVHRALTTVIEELQAIDWYHQRAERTADAELREVILHNRNEEIEHATMALEWLRRHMPEFDVQFRTYFFTEIPITQVESQKEDTGKRTESGSNEEGRWDLGIGRGVGRT